MQFANFTNSPGLHYDTLICLKIGIRFYMFKQNYLVVSSK